MRASRRLRTVCAVFVSSLHADGAQGPHPELVVLPSVARPALYRIAQGKKGDELASARDAGCHAPDDGARRSWNWPTAVAHNESQPFASEPLARQFESMLALMMPGLQLRSAARSDLLTQQTPPFSSLPVFLDVADRLLPLHGRCPAGH